MSLYNSSRSFKIMSFFLKDASFFQGINLPVGFITVRLDQDEPIYHFSNFKENHLGIFVENHLGSTPVTSASTMFKDIQGSKYKEDEDALNEL